MAAAMTQLLVETAAATASPVLETIPPLRLGDAWGRQGKEFLAAAREVLFARHLAGASGEAIVREWTGVIDHLVRSLYEAARASYAERFTMLDQRVALIAQGGYGRAELNPCSDIDLLFIFPQARRRRSSRRSTRRSSTPCGTPASPSATRCAACATASSSAART